MKIEMLTPLLTPGERASMKAERAEWRRMDLIEEAARAVVSFDWSENDADAVAAINRLRSALNR